MKRKKKVVALFTGQEVANALFAAYPDRFKQVPVPSTLSFVGVDGGLRVDLDC